MITYEEAENMLEDILYGIPDELFKGLSGGVVLSAEVKLHPQSRPERPLYIMGEYCSNATGRRIDIYFGSFRVVHGRLCREDFKEKLRHTFAHELRHHIESLAGIASLNKFDEQRLDMYKSGIDIAEFKEPPIE